MTQKQLHAPMPPLLHRKLKWAVKVLGYVSLAEWCRDAARSTVRQAELMGSTNRSKDLIEQSEK